MVNPISTRIPLLSRLVALAIRLTPIAVWVGIHFLHKDNNDHQQRQRFLSELVEDPRKASIATTELIGRWGFSFTLGFHEPHRFLTHMLVHSSDAHLFSNCVSYFFAVSERALHQSRVDCDRGGGRPRVDGRPVFRVGSSGPYNYYESPRGRGGRYGGASVIGSAVRDLADSCLVMAFSGICALPAMAFKFQRDELKAAKSYGLGIEALETVVRRVHRAGTERVAMCGASAGICGLFGYNAARGRQYIGAMLFLLPEVFSMVAQDQAQQRTAPPSASFFSEYFTLAPASMTVGHAAHIGGFIAGFLLGLFRGREVDDEE